MPAGTRQNNEGDRVACYVQPAAMGATVTHDGLRALVDFRREAGQDVAFWAGLRSIGRFAKDMQREAQRREKAATLWLRHFTEVGKRYVYEMPLEMTAELDATFRCFWLGEGVRD